MYLHTRRNRNNDKLYFFNGDTNQHYLVKKMLINFLRRFIEIFTL